MKIHIDIEVEDEEIIELLREIIELLEEYIPAHAGDYPCTIYICFLWTTLSCTIVFNLWKNVDGCVM